MIAAEAARTTAAAVTRSTSDAKNSNKKDGGQGRLKAV